MSWLPKGWADAAIAEVTAPFASTDPSRTPDRVFKYVDIGSIDNRTQTISDPKSIKGNNAPSRARRVIKEGDTLFSTVRTYLKNIALVPAELDGELTSTGVAVLRPNRTVDPQFLFRWTCTAEFLDPISRTQDGTMYPAVSDNDVAGGRIRVPPLPEQRRIVAKIDSLSAKSARARANLDHIPRLVEKYKQAVLAAAYGGFWSREVAPLRPLYHFIQTLDQGWSPKCDNEPASSNLEWAVMKTTAVQPISFFSGANKRLPQALQPRPELELRPGDVIVTRAGPRSRVAITCVVKKTRPRLMLCDKAYRLRVASDRAEPEYLALMLNSPDALFRLESLKTGISDSGLNLTQSKFLALELPCPSVVEQRETVRRIETAFAWIDRLAEEAASARKLVDHLDQAVLAKAFRGELVPQDPNDEPASVLLERIKTERQAGVKSGRGRRSRTAQV